MTRQEYTEWALDQLNRYGIRHPNSYTEEELKKYNPQVPSNFIKEHVNKKVSYNERQHQVTVYIDETLTKTKVERPALIIIVTHLVRSKRAKTVKQAFEMLNSGAVDAEEIEKEIIESYKPKRAKSDEDDKMLEQLNWQSNAFVMRRLWVRFLPPAPFPKLKIR